MLTVAVVADDTDILVLLLHHNCNSIADIFFVGHAKKSYIENSHYSIRSICSRLGHDICQQAAGAHYAIIGGCDTVLALYGINKVANKRFSTSSLHKDPVTVLLTLYSPRKLLRMVLLKQACNL